jgi:hypothetical protein
MIPSFEMRRCAGHRLVAQTWGAVAGAAIGVVGSQMSSRGGGGTQTNGGAGTTTQSKEPWAAAQPWIMNNLQTGQAMQNRYAAQPFSDAQNQAYQNQSNQSAYMGALVPSLLGQMSGQQVGFDRSNPNARPTAFDFNGANQAGQAAAAQNEAQRQQGLLAMLSRQQQAPVNLNPAPAAAAPAGTFVQQVQSQNPLDQYNSLLRVGKTPEQLAQAGIDPMAGMNGSYGSFKYGMPMPQPGTKEYRDMNEYFAYGGVDPYNMYGKGVKIEDYMPKGYGNTYGNGAATDDGGAAAAVGSSANF